MTGASRVARFYVGLMRKRVPTGYAIRMLNGLPALVVDVAGAPPRIAPRVVVRCEIDDQERLACVHTLLARAKVAGVAS